MFKKLTVLLLGLSVSLTAFADEPEQLLCTATAVDCDKLIALDAQVDQLKQRLDARGRVNTDHVSRSELDPILARLSALEDQIKTAAGPAPEGAPPVDLSALESRIAAIESELADIKRRIAELEADVADLKATKLYIGIGFEGAITGQEPVDDLAGSVIYRFGPTAHLSLGEAYSSAFFEGEVGGFVGHWRAYGWDTRWQLGYTFSNGLSLAALAGYTDTGIWANLDLAPFDVVYEGVDLGVGIGYRPTERVRLNLDVTIQPLSRLSTAVVAGKAERLLTHGQPTASFSITVFPRFGGGGQREEATTTHVTEESVSVDESKPARRGKRDFGSGTTVEVLSSPEHPAPAEEPAPTESSEEIPAEIPPVP